MSLVSVCFVLFICCVVEYEAAITEAQKSKIHMKLLTSGLDCLKDHPLSFEHIKIFRERKVPEDEDAKCYVKCIFKNLEIMEDNGKLSEKKAKESARKIFKEGDEMLANVEKIIDECIKVNDEETSDGEKGCDRAQLAFQCFVKHAPKLGLDVDF